MADIRESVLTAWQAALVDKLAGIGKPVYAVRPQAADGGSDADYPHIHLDPPVATAWDTSTEDGRDIVQRVHVRWRGQSLVPGQQLMAEVYDLLHHGDLQMTGWRLVLLQFEQEFVTDLGGSFDGVCEYRGLVEKS